MQTERLSAQADEHEALHQERIIEDAVAKEERMDARADAAAGKAAVERHTAL